MQKNQLKFKILHKCSSEQHMARRCVWESIFVRINKHTLEWVIKKLSGQVGFFERVGDYFLLQHKDFLRREWLTSYNIFKIPWMTVEMY